MAYHSVADRTSGKNIAAKLSDIVNGTSPKRAMRCRAQAVHDFADD